MVEAFGRRVTKYGGSASVRDVTRVNAEQVSKRTNHNERRGGALGDADHDGIPNKFDRDSHFYDARATHRHAQWGDVDATAW